MVDGQASARKGLSARERGLVVALVVALVAAAVGFALYFASLAPSDAAAKVDGEYLSEGEVASWIEQYRTAYGLEDDADFATALLSNGENVTTFRQSVVNQLALAMLVEDKAAELGLTPTDEEVQEQIDAAKEAYALGDDEVWAETLDGFGLTEDGLRDQYRANLAQQAVLEAEVPQRDADDAEVLAYLQDYLAGSTQKHAMRIVFEGDDKTERAQACAAELSALSEAGELDAQSFAEVAREYSDEEGVAESGGAYAWSGAGMSDEVKELLQDLEVGQYSDAETVEADDAMEIVFCDEAYEFPSASDMESIPEDVPTNSWKKCARPPQRPHGATTATPTSRPCC